MDAGLFIVLLACIVSVIYIFDKILDFIIYKPRHIKKDKPKEDEFWSDKDE
jgi:hypothetical protein